MAHERVCHAVRFDDERDAGFIVNQLEKLQQVVKHFEERIESGEDVRKCRVPRVDDCSNPSSVLLAMYVADVAVRRVPAQQPQRRNGGALWGSHSGKVNGENNTPIMTRKNTRHSNISYSRSFNDLTRKNNMILRTGKRIQTTPRVQSVRFANLKAVKNNLKSLAKSIKTQKRLHRGKIERKGEKNCKSRAANLGSASAGIAETVTVRHSMQRDFERLVAANHQEGGFVRNALSTLLLLGFRKN